MEVRNRVGNERGNDNVAQQEQMEVLRDEYIDPQQAYPMLDAIRSGFHVGSLGLGAAEQISSQASLITSITVEGFCSVLAAVLFFTELVNVIAARITGDAERANHHFLGGYSVYLCFRACCIMASLAGVGLIASELPAQTVLPTPAQNATDFNATQTDITTVAHIPGIRTTVGMLLMAVSIFTNRSLNARYTTTTVTKTTKDAENNKDEIVKINEEANKKKLTL